MRMLDEINDFVTMEFSDRLHPLTQGLDAEYQEFMSTFPAFFEDVNGG
jgi:hypothetical protein